MGASGFNACKMRRCICYLSTFDFDRRFSDQILPSAMAKEVVARNVVIDVDCTIVIDVDCTNYHVISCDEL